MSRITKGTNFTTEASRTFKRVVVVKASSFDLSSHPSSSCSIFPSHPIPLVLKTTGSEVTNENSAFASSLGNLDLGLFIFIDLRSSPYSILLLVAGSSSNFEVRKMEDSES